MSGVTSGVKHTYMYEVKTINYSTLFLLCQETQIATYNRRILYYVYHTWQSRS